MIGVQTIGNATLIAYDQKPIISTDPWMGEDHYAFFGSWHLPHHIPANLKNDIIKKTYDDLYKIAAKGIANKKKRGESFKEVREKYLESVGAADNEEFDQFLFNKYFHDVEKDAIRNSVLDSKLRLDGRKLDEIRPIWSEIDYLPNAHGSAIFTRGETQSLTSVTLGTKLDEQMIDGAMNSGYNKFILHYNFPGYSTGEVRPNRGAGRREIGHGNLALRALKNMLPSDEDNPYTIRIVSEIMESNGSSSMASVCGGSLSLMCAGAPLKSHVAGIAMGLITDGKRNAILSDILGLEDHLGDMDFKVAGTRDGISAIQLDLKIEGISFELIEEALTQAHEGRMHILDKMYESVPEPGEMSDYAPRILSVQINPEKIGALIGPGGKNIKKIIEDTQCEVNVDDDGIVTVAGKDSKMCAEAIKVVEAITFEPEVGMEFEGKVTRLMAFGAFVEFAPGREGLVHISELEWRRVEKVEDVCSPGDLMKIKLVKIDDQGRLDFSRKALLEKPEGWKPPPKRDNRSNNRNRGRNPNRGKRY